jgi:transcription antitermination factor NusG
MSDVVLNWYVFETFASAEWQVFRELEKQGFQVWLGWYLDDVTRGRFKSGRTRVHIEGYVFVRADRKWLRSARKISGIKDLIAYADGSPAAIDDGIMDELMTRLSTHAKLKIEETPLLAFEEDQKRKLISGPFAGFIAQIARVVSFDVIAVWVEAMGRKVKIEVPPDQLSTAIVPGRHCA